MFTLAIHGGELSHDQTLAGAKRLPSQIFNTVSKWGQPFWQMAEALERHSGGVSVLEDSPLFNAGKGSVFACDGVQRWMQASWMVNRALLVPFVTSAPFIPIKAAKLIMEQTPHVMLYGKDAEALAGEHQLDMKDPKWFPHPIPLGPASAGQCGNIFWIMNRFHRSA